MEKWKDIQGFNGLYQISNHGRVKSNNQYKNKQPGRILKVYVRKDTKYCVITLRKNIFYVHSLVAAAFIGPRPFNHEVNHIDTNKLNNKESNLEYLTRLDNVHHAILNGKMPRRLGEKNSQAILTANKIIKIRSQYLRGKTSYTKLSKNFHCSKGNIRDIIKRKSWKHI